MKGFKFMRLLFTILTLILSLKGYSQNSYELLSHERFDYSSIELRIDENHKNTIIQKIVHGCDSALFGQLFKYHFGIVSIDNNIKLISKDFHIIDINNDEHFDAIFEGNYSNADFNGVIIYLNENDSFREIYACNNAQITNMYFSNQVLDNLTIYSEPGATRIYNYYCLYKYFGFDSISNVKTLLVPIGINNFPWQKRNGKFKIICDSVVLRDNLKYLDTIPKKLKISVSGQDQNEISTFYGPKFKKGVQGDLLYELNYDTHKSYFVEIPIIVVNENSFVCGFIKESEIEIEK